MWLISQLHIQICRKNTEYNRLKFKYYGPNVILNLGKILNCFGHCKTAPLKKRMHHLPLNLMKRTRERQTYQKKIHLDWFFLSTETSLNLDWTRVSLAGNFAWNNEVSHWLTASKKNCSLGFSCDWLQMSFNFSKEGDTTFQISYGGKFVSDGGDISYMGGETHIFQTKAQALFRGLKNDFPCLWMVSKSGTNYCMIPWNISKS